MAEGRTCLSCGAPLFYNGAASQWQHKESWRDRDHFPTTGKDNSGGMAQARLGSRHRYG